MSDETRTRRPVSLDALLSANRESFDRLFQDQMAGGRAARRAPAAAAPEPAPAAAGDDNVVADLNRRFATDWSSEVLEREIRDGRASVKCRLTVGRETRTATGSSRVREDGEGAAMQRATDRALKACADLLGSAPQAADTPAARQRSQSAPADAVAVNRVEVALEMVRREMAAVLGRSALSPVGEAGPTGIAMVMDGRGNMVSGRYGSFLAHMLEQRKLHFAPGDVLLLSDPYATGGASGGLGHWLVVAPVHHGSDLVGFTAMHGHMADVGGIAEGSRSAEARSIFAEGVRIPPVKIVERGAVNEAALAVILANSRAPEANRVDLMALIEACRAGGAQIARLCDRLGAGTYQGACEALRKRAVDVIRRAIVERLPEEPLSFEDQIDDDGCGNGPFRMKLTVWREDDHAYFDWTGTSAQAPGPVNFYLHVGLAKMFVGQYLAGSLDPKAAWNDGYYDLIHVTLPRGTLLNPAEPAALGRREHALTRQLEVLGAAMDRNTPARLTAAGCGTPATFAYEGDGFRLADRVFGGLPGGPGGDGADGRALWPGETVRDAEGIETDFPIVIESCRCLPNSGGAGRHRGGAAVEKVYRVLEAGHVSISDDRHASRPWGVNGGLPGQASQKWIDRADGSREMLPAKADRIAVMPNDRITFRTAGGGGAGNPMERDAQSVRRDVAAGLVTAEAAGAEYGVVFVAGSLEIDRRATAELREGLSRERKAAKTFDRGSPG